MVEHAPFGAEVWVDKLDNGMGWAMDPNAEATKDAWTPWRKRSVWLRSTRARVVPSRSFRNCSASSEAQVLVTGPEDPKANAHSPNESISLPALKNNVITEALLLDKLAK